MKKPFMEWGWSPGGHRATCGELDGAECYLFCVVLIATLPRAGTRAAIWSRDHVGCRCKGVVSRRLLCRDTLRKKVGDVLRASRDTCGVDGD